MQTTTVVRCHRCSMRFNSINQLSLHRSKFCVGSDKPSKDPWLDSIDRNLAEDKINQLLAMKDANVRRSRYRDNEERVLLAQLKQPPSYTTRHDFSEPTMQNLERVYGKSIPASVVAQLLSSRVHPATYNSKNRSTAHNDWSPEDIETYMKLATDIYGDSLPAHVVGQMISGDAAVVLQLKANLNHQVGLLSERHDKSLKIIQDQSHKLDKRLREVDERLSQIKGHTITPLGNRQGKDNSDVTQLLAVQDEKNRQLIKELENKILKLQTLHEKTDTKPAIPQPFVWNGDSLMAEIGALFQYYINNGGKNTAVLIQLTNMLKDAEQLEKNIPAKGPRNGQIFAKRQNPYTEELVALELENQHLQNELSLLEIAERKTKEPDDNSAEQLRHLQKQHLYTMSKLKQEMEYTKHQLLLEQMKNELDKQVNARKHPQPSISLSDSNEEIKGFDCFYDFVLGLDQSIKLIKLVVGLYNNNTEFGEPSLLPTVHTELSHNLNDENVAVIGARQLVPVCPSSNNICLVIEMQTSKTFKEALQTVAWSKLDLFGQDNHLVSGAWKIPFRYPPIKPSMLTSEMNSLPSYGNAILHLRIVEHSDAAVHARHAVSTANSPGYSFPPQKWGQSPLVTGSVPYSWM